MYSAMILHGRIRAPWWEQLGGMPDLIVKAVGVMNEFYTGNPLRRNDNPYEQSPASFGNGEDLDRTRGRGDVGNNRQTPTQEDRAQPQRSQNGHSQQDGDVENSTSVMNSNKTAEHPSTGAFENGMPASPQSQPAPNASTHSQLVSNA
ncbi:uncharacterized protein K441DRAFT_676943 [Cenococcum geophilum 1.58]|uniref:uncharacterized protein n=1 Tax=Cenococcum geophilum 1.58 TaxID=794803 RepID=UPI00358E5301|nr:hypothetical protein K441DRAFT_676943 [Cenococcum geophilum 1.58]